MLNAYPVLCPGLTRCCPVFCVIQEEDYEWGGPGTESHISSLAETLAKLARAARRWRVTLSERRLVMLFAF